MRPSARKNELLVQEVDGEVLVYDLETSKALCLNETSAFIWQSCNGARDTREIADLVKEKFGTSVNEELVWFALNQLNKENLLNPAVDYSDKFEGVSRRDAVRKIGLASMVALPVVSSLVVPEAAYAQSCVPLTNCTSLNMRGAGCPCTLGSQCCDMTCLNVMGDMMGTIC